MSRVLWLCHFQCVTHSGISVQPGSAISVWPSPLPPAPAVLCGQKLTGAQGRCRNEGSPAAPPCPAVGGSGCPPPAFGDQGLCLEAPGAPQPSYSLSPTHQTLLAVPAPCMNLAGGSVPVCLRVPQDVSGQMSSFRVTLGSAELSARGSSGWQP